MSDAGDPSLVALLERTTIAAAWRRPDTQIVERDGWFSTVTPSAPVTALNRVLRSVLSGGPADVDATIDEALARYLEHELPMEWVVGPSARPRDLGERLAKRGLDHDADFVGMSADAAVLASAVAPAADISVEPLDRANLDEWVRAAAEGWGSTDEETDSLRADVSRLLRDEAGLLHYVLARLDGEPAGTGAVRMLPESGYFIATAVVPRFRGRGVYRALVAHRAGLVRDTGRKLVTTFAKSTTSAPICARLGFRAICELSIFSRRERDRSTARDGSGAA